MNFKDDTEFKLDIPDELISKCIHCGLCLPTCPTYNLTFNEQSSPRGRIQLMRNVQYNNSEISDLFAYEMNFCLDCQACETACPAGVKYGSLVEEARNIISKSKKEKLSTKVFKFLFLNYLISEPLRLKQLSKIYKILQQIFFIDKISNLFLKFLPNSILINKLNLIPKISSKPFDESELEFLPAYGKSKFDVLFPYGCIMNICFADVNKDTVEVLRHAGCNVLIPKNQFCCGSLHGHNGEKINAVNLATKNLLLFKNLKFDYVIHNSAGCCAFTKEYQILFEGNYELKNIASEVSEKSREFSEFLSQINFTPPISSVIKKITYQDACHLIHTQKIFKEPREIISKLKNFDFTEMNEASWCCGSAGLYNVTQTADSLKILDRKMDNIEKTNSQLVIVNNPGCLLQLKLGIAKRNLNIEAIHLATLIHRIYKKEIECVN